MFALGGAISRIPKKETAYVHRDSRFLLAIDSSWASNDSDRTGQANIDWVEGFADGMRAYTTESTPTRTSSLARRPTRHTPTTVTTSLG